MWRRVADLQLHGGAESVCYAKQLRCAKASAIPSASQCYLLRSRLQSVQPDKGDECKIDD
jgi:hypothetical protein